MLPQLVSDSRGQVIPCLGLLNSWDPMSTLSELAHLLIFEMGTEGLKNGTRYPWKADMPGSVKRSPAKLTHTHTQGKPPR
jgi:hypothetical protein